MDTLKLILLAGGGYLLYEYFIAPSTTAATAASSGSTATTAGGGVPVAAASAAAPAPAPAPAPVSGAPPSGVSIMQLVQNAAMAAGQPANALLTCDQWNFYYQQVRGVAAFDCGSITGYNRSENISLAEFWAMGAPYGLSGLGRYRGGRAGMGRYGAAPVRRRGMGNYVYA